MTEAPFEVRSGCSDTRYVGGEHWGLCMVEVVVNVVACHHHGIVRRRRRCCCNDVARRRRAWGSSSV